MDSRRISRAELARTSNVSYSTVSRWFEGSDPNPRTVADIASALRVNKNWLLFGDGEMDVNSSALREDPPPRPERSVAEARVVSALEQLPVSEIGTSILEDIDAVAGTGTIRPWVRVGVEVLVRKIEHLQAELDAVKSKIHISYPTKQNRERDEKNKRES